MNNKFNAPNSYEGIVIKVDNEKFTCDVISETGFVLKDCLIPKNGGYSTPEINDKVLVFMISETKKLLYMGKVPEYNLIKKGSEPNETKNRTVRDFSGHEFIEEEIGPDVGGGAKERRRDAKPGDHIVFDKNGSYARANQTGDVSFVISDILQFHFIKKWDMIKSFFRRIFIRWPGGKIEMGDYKNHSNISKEEDIDISIYNSTRNREGVRWRFQYGNNIDNGEQDQLLQIDKFITKPGTSPTKNSPAEEQLRSTYKEFKNGKVDFFLEDAQQQKVFILKNDPLDEKRVELEFKNGGSSKIKILLNTSTGDVSIENYGNLSTVCHGNVNMQSDGDIFVNSNSSINVSGSPITINGKGDLRLI